MSGNSTSADSHAKGRPKTTVSKCVTESVTATHNFEVADFSLLCGMGVGKFVGSTTFSVAGCDWNIRIYPDGSNTENNGAYVSVFLYFRKGFTGVRVKFSLSLLNKDASMSTLRNPMLFKRNFGSIGGDWGHEKFMEKSKLQEFLLLNHDNLTVRCDLTVIGESRSDEVEAVNTVVLPPANLSQDLARMLKDGEGTDVTFDVDGNLFSAHRCLLAARSPVFKALLFGPMKANAAQHIKIDDIESAIFEALLHFIYTDSIPPPSDDDCGGTGAQQDNVMLQHLVAAADQYGVDRLRLTCEARLCRGIDVLTVGTTLALAERHHCIQLKDACLEFIASHDMLGAIMETDGFKHLLASCPFIMKEILDKIADARAGAR